MILRFTALAALVAVFGVIAGAQTTTPPPFRRTISVTGTATQMVQPDVGIVVLAVQTQADTVAAAVRENNTRSTRVLDAIRRLNIARETTRTLGFEVIPIYETIPPNQPIPPTRRIVGYQVTNRIEVRIVNKQSNQLSTAISRVLEAALNAGANRVDSITFDLENPQAAMLSVLAQATRNAREIATTLARAADVELGPLDSLSTVPSYYQPLRAEAQRAAVGAVPIEVGPLTLQATVTAVYSIR
ncbi:MAG: SIMPL domain-containing protein [Armatimonadota bacterium]